MHLREALSLICLFLPTQVALGAPQRGLSIYLVVAKIPPLSPDCSLLEPHFPMIPDMSSQELPPLLLICFSDRKRALGGHCAKEKSYLYQRPEVPGSGPHVRTDIPA